jgi:hypothetical protein
MRTPLSTKDTKFHEEIEELHLPVSLRGHLRRTPIIIWFFFVSFVEQSFLMKLRFVDFRQTFSERFTVRWHHDRAAGAAFSCLPYTLRQRPTGENDEEDFSVARFRTRRTQLTQGGSNVEHVLLPV